MTLGKGFSQPFGYTGLAASGTFGGRTHGVRIHPRKRNSGCIVKEKTVLSLRCFTVTYFGMLRYTVSRKRLGLAAASFLVEFSYTADTGCLTGKRVPLPVGLWGTLRALRVPGRLVGLSPTKACGKIVSASWKAVTVLRYKTRRLGPQPSVRCIRYDECLTEERLGLAASFFLSRPEQDGKLFPERIVSVFRKEGFAILLVLALTHAGELPADAGPPLRRCVFEELRLVL